MPFSFLFIFISALFVSPASATTDFSPTLTPQAQKVLDYYQREKLFQEAIWLLETMDYFNLRKK